MPVLPHQLQLHATIIIPQFDHPELTIQAIRSLRQTDRLRWPVLVVDNGSSPQSLRQLHDLADNDTEIVSLPRPGLTAAWNIAASRCRTSHLVFLNNDTLSKGPWVDRLLAPLLRNEAHVTCAELRRETHLASPIEIPSGWCFAVRFDTFHAVGGFDEALHLYFSDTDFLLRVRERFSSSTLLPWAVVPHLPLVHLSHRTAHQLPDQRTVWIADRTRFLSRWIRG